MPTVYFTHDVLAARPNSRLPAMDEWSEWEDGWELRRVERSGDRWFLKRERWALASSRLRQFPPKTNFVKQSEFEAVWYAAWEHGVEIVHGGDTRVMQEFDLDPSESIHRRWPVKHRVLLVWGSPMVSVPLEVLLAAGWAADLEAHSVRAYGSAEGSVLERLRQGTFAAIVIDLGADIDDSILVARAICQAHPLIPIFFLQATAEERIEAERAVPSAVSAELSSLVELLEPHRSR